MAQQLTPTQKLQRAHVSLVRSEPFAMISGLLMLGETKVLSAEEWSQKYGDSFPKTACTNGRDKYYHEEFITGLPAKQLAFLVAHETFHVLYKQTLTWKHLHKLNPQLLNVAMDFVVNQIIVDLDPNGDVVEFIPGGCLDSKYKGMSTGQVFDLLKKDGGGGSGKGSGSGSAGDPLDGHDFEEVESLSEADRTELEQIVDQAIRQGEILAGKMKGKSPRDLGLIPEPQVDWRKQLADFVTSVTAGHDMSTWRKPHRRWLANDVYMPTTFSEAVGEIIVGVDTSGSVSRKEMEACLAEVQSVCKQVAPEKLHLLYWDTAIASEETYEPAEYEDILSKTKPAGFGGTDPHCVQYWLTQQAVKPRLAIMLTDGGIYQWPDLGIPTLWVITDKRTTAPNGVTIHLEV